MGLLKSCRVLATSAGRSLTPATGRKMDRNFQGARVGGAVKRDGDGESVSVSGGHRERERERESI